MCWVKGVPGCTGTGAPREFTEFQHGIIREEGDGYNV